MNFSLAGNSKIKTIVTNAIKENRIPHAILIEGDKGTGRHTLAFYLASAVVCGKENAPCGVCKNCLLKINHPDISVTAPEENKKNISVSQIRALKTEAYIKPHQAQKRVFVIDFADTLNEQSQNALLKVLEEPPESTVFILIAESKASLLSTVISRCVVLTLTTPEESEAFEYIQSVTDFSKTDILEALQNSKNNIGNALAMLNGKNDIGTMSSAKEFLDFFFKGNTFEMLKITAPFEKSRTNTDLFLNDLKYVIGNMLKENLNNYKALLLSKLYELIKEIEPSLITNINLTLLFCTLVSRAEAIIHSN